VAFLNFIIRKKTIFNWGSKSNRPRCNDHMRWWTLPRLRHAARLAALARSWWR